MINSQAGFTLKNALLFWHELRPNVISREEAREFQIGCLAACGRRMWLCYLWQPIHRKSNANIRVTEQCTSQIPVYTTVGPCVNVQAVHRCVCVCVCDVAEHALSCRRPPQTAAPSSCISQSCSSVTTGMQLRTVSHTQTYTHTHKEAHHPLNHIKLIHCVAMIW